MEGGWGRCTAATTIGLVLALVPVVASAQSSVPPDDSELGEVPPPPGDGPPPPPPGRTAPPPRTPPDPPPRRMRTADPHAQPRRAPAPPRHAVNAGFSIATAWGGGKRFEPEDAREALFDFGVRADLVLSPGDRSKVWGLGPTFDLHTADFDTLEIGGGLHLRVRLPDPFDVWWAVGAARSVVPDAWDGGVFFATFAIGGRYRGRDECAAAVCYEPRFGGYVTYREGFVGDSDVRTVTGGIEVDISLAVFVLEAL